MTRFKSLILCLVMPLIFILDQITKAFIVKYLPLGAKFTVWPFFDIVHVRNRGAAFGILSGWNSHYRDILFYIFAFLAFIFLIHYLIGIKEKHRWQMFPVAMILGGALGNVSDRVFRGSVVDFLSFHWYDWAWPSFNVADSAISVGVVGLMIAMMRESKGHL